MVCRWMIWLLAAVIVVIRLATLLATYPMLSLYLTTSRKFKLLALAKR